MNNNRHSIRLDSCQGAKESHSSIHPSTRSLVGPFDPSPFGSTKANTLLQLSLTQRAAKTLANPWLGVTLEVTWTLALFVSSLLANNLICVDFYHPSPRSRLPSAGLAETRSRSRLTSRLGSDRVRKRLVKANFSQISSTHSGSLAIHMQIGARFCWQIGAHKGQKS